MSQRPTKRKGAGIYTISDLMERCWVDETSGCWHWRGCFSNGKTPSLKLPALARTVTLGTAICWLTKGREPLPGHYWHVTCTTSNCGNPKHRTEGTRSSQMLAPATKPKGPLHRQRVAAALRAKSSQCNEEKAAAIRQSAGSLTVLAQQHGISIATAWRIRHNKSWRQDLVPNSAFSQRIAK